MEHLKKARNVRAKEYSNASSIRYNNARVSVLSKPDCYILQCRIIDHDSANHKSSDVCVLHGKLVQTSIKMSYEGAEALLLTLANELGYIVIDSPFMKR
jgi:hypothetical protein